MRTGSLIAPQCTARLRRAEFPAPCALPPALTRRRPIDEPPRLDASGRLRDGIIGAVANLLQDLALRLPLHEHDAQLRGADHRLRDRDAPHAELRPEHL